MATPNLNVEFSAVKDEHGKFARLATLLGLADADHARGKCEHLWMACTVRGESKLGLPVWLVEQVLGERGPDALVEAELASWSRGRGDAKTRRLRIAGAVKHCSWMASNTDKASKGGKSRASTASRAGGKFTSNATSQNQPYPPHPHSDPPDQDQIPDPPPARAIPPVVVQAEPAGAAGDQRALQPEPVQPPPIHLPVAWSGPPDHRALAARRALAAEIRAEVDASRRRAAAAIPGAKFRPLDAQDPGERKLADYIVNADSLADARETLLHVVAMAEVEAIAKQGLQWLTLSAIFSDGNRTRFAGGTAAEFARKPAKSRGMTDVKATPDEMAVARKVLAQLSEDSGITWRVDDGHASLVVERLRDLVRSGVDTYRAGRELQAVVTDRGDAWKGKEAMVENLKPSTVFGEKFAEYRSIALARYGADIRRDVERRADEKRKAGA